MDGATELLPPSNVGEIIIRGVNVTQGYESEAEANREALYAGWFRTGDQDR